jgi:hypothetical protein
MTFVRHGREEAHLRLMKLAGASCIHALYSPEGEQYEDRSQDQEDSRFNGLKIPEPAGRLVTYQPVVPM